MPGASGQNVKHGVIGDADHFPPAFLAWYRDLYYHLANSFLCQASSTRNDKKVDLGMTPLNRSSFFKVFGWNDMFIFSEVIYTLSTPSVL